MGVTFKFSTGVEKDNEHSRSIVASHVSRNKEVVYM